MMITTNPTLFRTLLVAIVFAGTTTFPAWGQQAAGFFPLNRLGVSYQKAVGIDLGLGAYNILFGRQLNHFFDVSLGSEAIFAKQFVLVPKLNADIGFDIAKALTFGGGVDVGWHTDFSQGTWRLSPKAGLTAGSVIRLYYARHLYVDRQPFVHIGQHRVSLEVNLAAFHNLKMSF